MTRPLSVTRSSDREKMAQAVESLCSEYGALCERSEYSGKRAILLHITIKDLTVSIEFDGDSQMDREGTFCMPWRVALGRPDLRMSDTFGCAVGGSVNPYHRHKCTAFSCDFPNLLQRIENGFMVIKNGSAFL